MKKQENELDQDFLTLQQMDQELTYDHWRELMTHLNRKIVREGGTRQPINYDEFRAYKRMRGKIWKHLPLSSTQSTDS